MKFKRTLFTIAIPFIVFGLILSACGTAAAAENLTASGTISATSINIAPELGGKVQEIYFDEGGMVQSGDVLFSLDAELFKAQQRQVAASLARAQAGLEAARAQKAAAETQYSLALYSSQMTAPQGADITWSTAQDDAIQMPNWYFLKTEEIVALKSEMESAQTALDSEMTDLQKLLDDTSSQDFVILEKNLAETQAAYRLASQTMDQAEAALDNEELKKAAQDSLDIAQADLETAQKDYDRALTSSHAQDILEQRARVAVAQSRYDNSVDAYNALLTRNQSLQVQAALDAANQAAAGLTAAEAAVSEAQAGLDLINLQISKTDIKAPIDGVILSKSLEVGELVGQGSTVMVIGKLDTVDLTVYVSETQYGRIQLDQQVEVTVDSYAGKTYQGTVVYISDQAEFTPSNVQTADGRRSTVYAIKISISNPGYELKPGMPADVSFIFQ